MTWRRFSSLLRNLSGASMWALHARAAGKRPRVITDEAEGQRYFDSI